MSEIKTLIKQSSHYLAGRLIIMAAGFISFPILTRIFSVSDYGTLGLISTTLFIALAVGKFGFPNSIVRYYAEFKANKQLDRFYSTIFWGSLLLTAVIGIIFVLVAQLILKHYWREDIAILLTLVAMLIVINAMSDILTCFMRAEQRTKIYNGIAIIGRYGSLAASIFFTFYIFKGLYGFYIGQVISGAIIYLIIFYYFQGKRKISLNKFSPDFFKAIIRYGFPLIWVELGALILNYADRYLIQIYLGTTALGIYTAGYNLATYVNDMMIYSISYAMDPIYMNILVNKGENETKIFFAKTFRYYLLIMLPIVFGFIAVGDNLLLFLASSKYIEAAPVLPYIIIGQLVHACALILNSGLFISKKTHLIANITFISCLLNIGLNVLLIPIFGIVGSAQATLISYVFFTGVITYYAFKEFSFKIDVKNISIYFVASLVMFFIVKNIHAGSHLSSLIGQVSSGVIIYSVIVLLLDREIRANLIEIFKKWI